MVNRERKIIPSLHSTLLPIIIENNIYIEKPLVLHKNINNTTQSNLKTNHFNMNNKNINEKTYIEYLNNNIVINNFINVIKDENKIYSNIKNSPIDKIINSKSKQLNKPSNSFIFLSNKRGRPKKNNENNYLVKKKHSKLAVDNIIRKIQVHYLSFLVKYINFFLRKYLIKPYPVFSQLSYGFKKNITKEFRQSLENKKIGEILKNKESVKNKNSNEKNNSNKKIFDYVYNANTEIKKLLNINYLVFFKEVYANCAFDIYTYNTKRYKIPKTIENVTGLFEEDNDIYNDKVIEVCKNKFFKGNTKNNTNDR